MRIRELNPNRLRTTFLASLSGCVAASLIAGCADREEAPTASVPPPREVVNANPPSPSIPPPADADRRAAAEGTTAPGADPGKAETPAASSGAAPEVIEKPAEPTPSDRDPEAGAGPQDKGSEQP